MEGRGSFAEGCPSRKVAEGDVGKIQQIEYEFEYILMQLIFHVPYWNLILRWIASKSHVFYVVWVWLLYRFCFGVSRKPRGSFAEAPRKQNMPKQWYSLPMPSQSPSPRQTNVAKEKPKWKQMKAQKAKMKGNETNHNQKPRKKRSGAVVAEAKTKETRSRKLAEGLYVKCMSRKLALWSRKHCGSCCGSGE